MRIKYFLVAIALQINSSVFAIEPVDSYPIRPIKIVVPYGAGGAADQLTRVISEKLSNELRQSIVIENIAGGGTIIGTDKVAKALPDGYTLVLCSSTNFVNNPLFKTSLPYKVESDFIGIGLISASPMVLVAAPQANFNSVLDFVRFAKENPGKISYASAGNGSSLQLAAELFQAQTGIKMLHVPYKSNIEATQAVLSQQVDVTFDIALSSVSLINASKLKALGITNLKRLAILENVPTIGESGVPGFEINAWYGLAAPSGTAPEIIKKLNTSLQKVIKDPDLKTKFDQLGMELQGGNSEAVLTLARKERLHLMNLIKTRNIQIDQ
jgi:tripartite-type tricarboxylate transporter receptor subunit TctC